jgi:MFS family permease
MSGSRDNPSSSGIGGAISVLRHTPFLLFWLGACLSNTGNWTENTAQSWAVTSQTVGNPHQGFYVEMLQFADFCPVLILALVAGVISDRVNRTTWLIILQAAAGLLGAGLAIAAFMGRATPLVVIVFPFLEGIVWALNGPVFLAVVPSRLLKNTWFEK